MLPRNQLCGLAVKASIHTASDRQFGPSDTSPGLVARLARAFARLKGLPAGPSLSVCVVTTNPGARSSLVAMIRMAPPRARRMGERASAARSSCPEAFDDTVLCYLDAAYNLARFLTRDGVVAEDLVQEAILKAYRGYSTFRGGDGKAWLLTIVRREVIDWANARRRSDQVFSEAEDATIEDVLFDGDGPEEFVMKRDELATVRRAIYALPEVYRETVVLRDIEDLPYKQIAEITGVSLGTVMSRLARGRELLTCKLLGEAEPEKRPESGK